ncbi:MAG: hypothetical protein KDB68_16730, partial [Planctomycetes bacterium]|nr:hypothetical protein [Planctomycetota bacterium]
AILERTRGDEPFTDLDDLLTFLTNLSQQQPAPITSQQLGIFANQQRYPYAMRNSGAITAQFRFDSLDTYMVDAFATRYQPSGGTMARDAFREWVQIGSDVDRTYSWFTYEQMQREMELPQGNIMQLHAAGTTNQRMMGLVELPYLHYLADERLVRAWRGLSTNPGPPQPWTQRVAQNVNNLAQNNVRPEKFYSNVGQVQPSGSSATYEGGNLEAGMFSFWYRPHWTDHTANHYIFDTAEQEYSNRMSLLWWGDRKGAHRLSGKNSGLVLRVKDRTLQEAYTELRYELEPAHFRTGDWYNMALNWKGTELSHISLLLDGDAKSTAGGTAIQPVVNHTFRQPNGAWFTMTTTLQNDLEDPNIGGAITIDLQVDPLDIDGLPPRGVVVIGDEAIEYNGNNGYALLNIRRASRGTVASFHPDGSKVTVFGYTDGLRGYNSNNNNVDVPRFPNLPQTQGLLTGDLGVRTFYRVNKDGTNQPGYFRPTELGPDAGFPGAGDDTRGGDPFHLPLDDYTGLPDRGIVAVIGLAWNDYMPTGQTPGVPTSEQYPNWNDDGDSSTPPVGLGAYPVPRNVRDPMTVPPPNLNANPQILRLANLKMEYVAYDGIGGNGLNVIARYDQDFNYKAPNTWWHFLGAYTDLMVPQPGNQVDANIISFLSLGSVVMPLSIDVDSVLGYHPRSIVQVDNEWFFYNHLWNPDAGISNPGATPTGTDDNLFPNLSYLDFSRLTIFARHCIVNDNKNAPPFSPWRGAMGTGVGGHTAAARVVPTFGTTVRTGETDIITLVRDVNADKEQHQIVRHKPLTDMQVDWITFNASFSLGGVLPSPSAGNGNQYICALDDHTRVTFPANNANQWDRNTNLCKFPTGELPVELPTQWSFASGDPRTLDGGSQGLSLVNTADFDAFEFRMYNKGNFRLISSMTDNTPGNAQDLQVNTLLPPNMSVVHIDNELIAYRGTEVRQIQVTNPQTGQTSTIDTYWLLDITRGILGSPIEPHAGGTPIMNMASMRVGRPNASGTPRTSFIQTTMGAETFRPYGFIRIEEETGQTEIIGYQRYQELQLPDPNNPNVLVRTGNVNCGVYNNPDDSQALFRGAYGTRAMGYSNRALMFDQPVRFPDWFPNYRRTLTRNNTTRDEPFHTDPTEGIPGAESPEISYFQGSAAFRNSVYKDFRWRIQYTPLADMSRHSNAIGARLVMRFKHPGRQMASWGSIPTNRIGGLYSFEFDPGAYNCEEVPGGITLWEQTEDLTNFPDAPGGIRAERIEWRVYFYFKRGAFEDENYKTTLQFQGASMNLNQLTRVVRHEEKR